jgi:hypothetical protein
MGGEAVARIARVAVSGLPHHIIQRGKRVFFGPRITAA